MKHIILDTPKKFSYHINNSLVRYSTIFTCSNSPLYHIFTVIGSGYGYDITKNSICTIPNKHIEHGKLRKKINDYVNNNKNCTVSDVYKHLLKSYSNEYLGRISYFDCLTYRPNKIAKPICSFKISNISVDKVYFDIKNDRESLYPMSLNYFILKGDVSPPKWLLDIAYKIILGSLKYIELDMKDNDEYDSYHYDFTEIKNHLETLGATL